MSLFLGPFLFVVAAWFFSTGAILWLDRRPADSWAGSLLVATAVSGAAFGIVLITRELSGPQAAYAAFAAGLLLWAWHEMSFLMGFVTGPRRDQLPDGVAGLGRFRLATAALIHHEVAMALTAVALILVSWGQPNQVAAQMFGLLFVMRLSTKLNIFVGVPHFADEMLPTHLHYLRSYYGKARAHPVNLLSVVLVAATMVGLAVGALAAEAAGAATGLALLAVLSMLGLVEHLFLMMPVRESALWRWAMKAGAGTMKGTVHGL